MSTNQSDTDFDTMDRRAVLRLAAGTGLVAAGGGLASRSAAAETEETIEWATSEDWSAAALTGDAVHESGVVRVPDAITESFETDLSGWTDSSGVFSTTTNASTEGNASLTTSSDDVELVAEDSALIPSQGDSFSIDVRHSNDSSGAVGFRLARQDAGNNYQFSVSGYNNCLFVRTVEGGNGTVLGQVDFQVSGGNWYTVDVDWNDDGSFAVEVFDASGSSLGSTTASDSNSTYTSGGFSLYSHGGTAHWDTYQLTAPSGTVTTTTKSFSEAVSPSLSGVTVSGSPTAIVRGSPSGTPEEQTVALGDDAALSWTNEHEEYEVTLELASGDEVDVVGLAGTVSTETETSTDDSDSTDETETTEETDTDDGTFWGGAGGGSDGLPSGSAVIATGATAALAGARALIRSQVE